MKMKAKFKDGSVGRSGEYVGIKALDEYFSFNENKNIAYQ